MLGEIWLDVYPAIDVLLSCIVPNELQIVKGAMNLPRNQAELAVPTSNIILTNEDALRQASGHDDYEILAETIMAESQATQRSVDIGEEVEGQRNEGGGGLGDEAVPSPRPGIDTPPITPTSR